MPNPVGAGQKSALLETFRAAVTLVPATLRSQFVVVGGTSLIILGGNRSTEDVDFLVTAEALLAFEEAASDHPLFSKGSMANWTYSCEGATTSGINVRLEFLAAGGAFARTFKVTQPAPPGFRGSLGESIRMKAAAYASREEPRDLEDLRFLMNRMAETNEGFEGMVIGPEDEEDMYYAANELGDQHAVLLERFLERR